MLCKLAGTSVLVLGLAAPVWGQTTRVPCVYEDERGRVTITDRAVDPRCAHLAPEAAEEGFRPPAPLRMTFGVAELLSLTHQAAERHRVDHRLVESLVEMESGFDPGAVSRKGAMGLMQLMPEVARIYGVVDPFDPWENLDAGVRHLRSLLLQYDADVGLALAAYNAGPGAVERHGGIPPYDETREYVQRVLYRYRQRIADGHGH